MRRIAFWSSLLLPTLAVVWGAWAGSFPLGVRGERGEWEWLRVAPDSGLGLSLIPPAVAAALYIGFVWLGQRRISRCRPAELAGWLGGLVACGFTWLWIVQESAPETYQLSKAAWVLYFRGSSGYFAEARDEAADLAAYLARYENKMAVGDVLHIGTHPPGLIVILRALLNLCERSPALVDLVLATEPDSVREAFAELRRTALHPPNPVAREHEAVLWLATLLLQAGAALTVAPLFGLLRMGFSRRASWLAAAFWPAVPALAVFIPKSDCLYPLLSTVLVWLWLTGLKRQSLLLAALTGLVLWVSLSLSLAFLPVALLAALITVGHYVGPCLRIRATPESPRSIETVQTRGLRQALKMTLAALTGFLVPCVMSWAMLKLNLAMVWWLNLRNHAAFYDRYSRTYWKWLLVNPLEFAVAAGMPLAVLAVWGISGQWRASRGRLPGHVWFGLGVLALLWLSGKNMGEAARLWILFIPFLVWFAGPVFEAAAPPKAHDRESASAAPSVALDSGSLAGPAWIAALALQFAAATAIVTRVAGFHYP
jgi:hypothetical protein